MQLEPIFLQLHGVGKSFATVLLRSVPASVTLAQSTRFGFRSASIRVRRPNINDFNADGIFSRDKSPYVERLIGSIRRECLDHIVVFNESSLRRTLKSYFAYYGRSRTHLALSKDAPESRSVQPPELGAVVEFPQVGGLHHRYERRAA
jgi:hypothetical protein